MRQRNVMGTYCLPDQKQHGHEHRQSRSGRHRDTHPNCRTDFRVRPGTKCLVLLSVSEQLLFSDYFPLNLYLYYIHVYWPEVIVPQLILPSDHKEIWDFDLLGRMLIPFLTDLLEWLPCVLTVFSEHVGVRR